MPDYIFCSIEDLDDSWDGEENYQFNDFPDFDGDFSDEEQNSQFNEFKLNFPDWHQD